MNCQISENLTVNFNAGFGQTVNHTSISQAVVTCSGINPLNPEATEIALADTSVAIGILPRFCDSLLGNFNGIFTTPIITLGFIKDNFMNSVGGKSALYS